MNNIDYYLIYYTDFDIYFDEDNNNFIEIDIVVEIVVDYNYNYYNYYN